MLFRIKEARKAANLTQKELAEKLGIKISTLSGYEIGAHDPKSNTLIEIARICNTTTDYLLGRNWTEAQGEASVDADVLSVYESELISLFRGLNDNGQDALMRQAKYLYSDPDMKKGSASNIETA